MAGAGTPEAGGDPGEPTIRVLETPEDASRVAAEVIATELQVAIGRRNRADWATTGGSAPVGVYRAMLAPAIRDSVAWTGVHVWWGDDRFVPRDHPFSNVQPFDEILFRLSGKSGQSGTGEDAFDPGGRMAPGVPILADHVHAMPMAIAIGAARDPSWVAAEYGRELRSANLEAGPGPFPRLDVIFIGVGPDGHVFSVFPGSTSFDGSWVAGVPAPEHLEPKVARVSLHPGFLAAARRVVLVAHGEGKAGILATVLGAERDPARWPVQHARRSNAVWVLDRAAASRLGGDAGATSAPNPGD